MTLFENKRMTDTGHLRDRNIPIDFDAKYRIETDERVMRGHLSEGGFLLVGRSQVSLVTFQNATVEVIDE